MISSKKISIKDFIEKQLIKLNNGKPYEEIERCVLFNELATKYDWLWTLYDKVDSEIHYSSLGCDTFHDFLKKFIDNVDNLNEEYIKRVLNFSTEFEKLIFMKEHNLLETKE